MRGDFVREHTSGTRLSNAQELLTIMGNREVQPETKKPQRTDWQQILMACCCIFVIAALGKGFLYLETEIGTVQSTVGSTVKNLATLRAEVTAIDTREQIATVTAELEDLKATNTQLWAEVQQLRETAEALKGRKNNGPARSKRR